MKKYTALFAALTLVLALAGCGAETQTPMPGQSEQEEFTQNSTENVNETDGMTLLDSVFDTLSEGTDVTITQEQRRLSLLRQRRLLSSRLVQNWLTPSNNSATFFTYIKRTCHCDMSFFVSIFLSPVFAFF